MTALFLSYRRVITFTQQRTVMERKVDKLPYLETSNQCNIVPKYAISTLLQNKPFCIYGYCRQSRFTYKKVNSGILFFV